MTVCSGFGGVLGDDGGLLLGPDGVRVGVGAGVGDEPGADG